MKNVMLAEPSTLVLLSTGLMVLLILAILIGAVIVLTVRYLFKKKSPVPPVALSTQILPRKCPQCGAELKSDVPEGLCPACLPQRGITTEGGAPPGTPPFVPPTIPDLAKLFPQLEILELIGKGGMGAVYKARQPSLDRFVALKILAPRSGGDLDFAGRFTREARALAKLSHPNIVAVYDFGQTENLSYFIMEFVDGPNLRQAGKLSPREAMEIIPQICTALQFAHDEGIVHRDIKPENVLLDKKGRVKSADFGLAKILGQEPQAFRLTGAKDIMGTPHYMAPEQVEHPQDVDHRADIYSLGVVFYEMLTGELPLGKFQPPSQKVQMDVRLDEVVLRSLAKEPELRYQHVSEVGTRVETIASSPEQPPAPATGIVKTESGMKPARPWRRGAFAGIGVFLAILVAAVVWAFIMSESFVGTARVKVNTLPGKTEESGSPQVYQETFTIQSSAVLLETAAALQLRQRWGGRYHVANMSDQQTLELMKGRLMIHALSNTRLVDISCYSESAVEAAEIANKIAENYCALPPGNRGEILDRAVPALRPAKPNRPLMITVGLLIGLGTGVFFGLLVGMVSWLRARASAPPQVVPPIQKPDRFWRRFAVVMACVLLIPVAISILGLLAAIAIPNFVRARNQAQAMREENAARKQLELAEQNAPVRSDYIGKTWFPKGDSIEILSVERSPERMAVKGRYNLVSADSAGLTLNITSTNQTGFPEDPNQSIRISKGRGDFELSRSHLVPGLPHVSMYANGGSFAGVYFGTQDEALEESQLDLGPTNAPSASDADQTVAGLPPVVVETQPVSGARDVEPGVAEIRVRFSKEMEDGSWSWSTAWQDSAPESIGQPRYESDRRTCVNKVKLEPGRTYAYWLNSENFHNFKDAADRPAIPYLLIFQTKEK